MVNYLFILYILLFLSVHETAKILGVVPSFSKSHQITFQPIWKELSLRGHEVTVLTPTPINDPSLVNLTEIQLKYNEKIMFKVRKYLPTASSEMNTIEHTRTIMDIYVKTIESQISFPEIRNLIEDEGKKFDLVLAQFLFPSFYGFSNKYGCPLVGLGNAPLFMDGYEALGNPQHPVLLPNVMLPFGIRLSFSERLQSTFYTIWYKYFRKNEVMVEADSVSKKLFGANTPHLEEIRNNVSMVLSVGNFLMYKVKPNLPALIDLENLYTTDTTQIIPKDLEEELDGASNGVVYLSFGSNSRYFVVTPEAMKLLLEIIAELPYKVFWKISQSELPGPVPENLVLRDWFPQRALLAHPKVKLFITHGGIRSIEEAISTEIPLIGVPFYVDQFSNLQKMQDLGVAKVISFETTTKAELKATISEAVENPSYRNRMRKLKIYMKDFPLTGVEEAIWWIEYVLRHKGGRHFKNPAMQLSWYQYYSLDVVAFLLSPFILTVMFLYKVTTSTRSKLQLKPNLSKLNCK